MDEQKTPDLNLNLITFGKYKDKYIPELLRDRKYCDWLLKQDWFFNYNYLYNALSEYNPRLFFIDIELYKNDLTTSTTEEFIDKYIYFNLKKIDELTIELLPDDLASYNFYLSLLDDLKKKIKVRIANEDKNPFDIKAPSKWLNKFETETKLSRDAFKDFLYAFDLPNVTIIIEEIKLQGGLTYSGGKTYQIGKDRSKKQEDFWEQLLREKYNSKISSQFKYKNCFFDFINISNNVLYECKLNIKDFNESQYEKYLIATKETYNIKYLISTDCVIDMDLETIYTTNIKEYLFYQMNIPLLKTPSIFDDIIFDFDIYEVENFNEIL